jgi:EcsC protein family
MRRNDSMRSSAPDSKALDVFKWVSNKAMDGVPPLSNAESLAMEYLIDTDFANDHDRVDSLIRWETSKNFTSGFITGLGGLITMPVTIPSSLGASWVIQARMSGAIARIYGKNLGDDRVRTFVMLSLLGNSCGEALKGAGIKIGQKLTEQAIQKIPGRALIEINKQVGFRLITKAGKTGVISMTKVVPLMGGLVGGGFDAASCRIVGKTAKKIFAPNQEP